MFRIECFVDDKQLSKLLWALSEFGAYNVSSVPVNDNTGARANGQHMPTTRRGDLGKLFVAYARKHKLRELDAAAIKQFGVAVGYMGSSRYYVKQQLMALGAIAKVPGSDKEHLKDTRYRVTLSKIKKPKAVKQVEA
jgi:hypothetical protein